MSLRKAPRDQAGNMLRGCVVMLTIHALAAIGLAVALGRVPTSFELIGGVAVLLIAAGVASFWISPRAPHPPRLRETPRGRWKWRGLMFLLAIWFVGGGSVTGVAAFQAAAGRPPSILEAIGSASIAAWGLFMLLLFVAWVIDKAGILRRAEPE